MSHRHTHQALDVSLLDFTTLMVESTSPLAVVVVVAVALVLLLMLDSVYIVGTHIFTLLSVKAVHVYRSQASAIFINKQTHTIYNILQFGYDQEHIFLL